MPIDFKKLVNGVTKQAVVIGSKKVSAGLPVNVTVSLDKDLKKTILVVAGMLAAGTALGVGAGIVISKNKRK